MRIGVNVPNFGPGTDPGMLRSWAQTVEGLGFDLLMVSDHVVVTPDVAAQYPAPFYEPFTTLSWLAGITTRVTLGTTVLIVPYRHPLVTARMAINLHDLSGGRFVLGVGVGWARQEFEALGVPFDRRGRLTDEYLDVMRAAWEGRDIPLWVGGSSEAAQRRAVRLGAAWHPLRYPMARLEESVERLAALAAEEDRPLPALVPRIALDLSPRAGNRLAGQGTIEQVAADLERLKALGAEAVVLDPFSGDPEETRRPERAWRDLAAVAAIRR
ncbi:LLM class flavin-dependent oxidoreductase [Nonomuraea sp. NPDC003727]